MSLPSKCHQKFLSDGKIKIDSQAKENNQSSLRHWMPPIYATNLPLGLLAASSFVPTRDDIYTLFLKPHVAPSRISYHITEVRNRTVEVGFKNLGF